MAWAFYQTRKIADCGMRREYLETFSPTPTSKETTSYRSRHASRHVRDARAVMHVGIANAKWRGKTFTAFPVHAHPAILRIWQEAHVFYLYPGETYMP